MDETKLTVRIARDTLTEAKRYAREHHTTLTRLVVTHLEHLHARPDAQADAPITRRLSGTLPPQASAGDYRDYLDSKYG